MERLKQILTDPLFIGVLLAFYGGTVRGMKCKRGEFTWWCFLFRVAASGFVGIVTGLVMQNTDYPPWIETAIIGISGYAAVDVLPALSDGFKSAIQTFRKIEIDK